MFIRKDYPTIMSGLVIRYIPEDEESNMYDYQINASRDGVSISGRWPIMTFEGAVVVEEYLTRARWHHRHIREQYTSVGMSSRKIVPLTEDQVVDMITRHIPLYDEE
jgi:hypothetical protein